MQVFIQVNLEHPAAFSYQRPLLTWLKNYNSNAVILDVDSFSDEMLVTQANRLLPEATQYVIYFKVAEPNAPLGTAFNLLEEVLREEKPGLILLEGTHTRLTAIFQSRPFLQFIPVNNPEEVKSHIKQYFNLPGAAN